MFQLFATSDLPPVPTQSFFSSDNAFLLVIIALTTVGIIVAVLFIIRALMQVKSRAEKAFSKYSSQKRENPKDKVDKSVVKTDWSKSKKKSVLQKHSLLRLQD